MFQHSLFFIYTALYLFYISFKAHAGYITPDPLNPIVSSVANKGELSDYTFKFTPETTLPIGTIADIEFPGQYRSGLGIPINPICSVPCVISGNSVKFTLPYVVPAGTSMTLTIKNVENPDMKGGTGSFKVLTSRGLNILDQNKIFGTIGIANTVSNLISPNVRLISGGNSNTGQTTRYAFYFKVSQFIPAGSYIRLTVTDTNFILAANPVCSAIAVNGKTIQGPFTCTTHNRDIVITGLSAEILAFQDVGLSVEMTNPTVAGITRTFNIAILRGGTNVIYDRRNDIEGVTITPSPISSVSLVPLDSTLLQAKGKTMDYYLTFKTKNALAQGSAISIQLPSGLRIDSTSTSTRLHYISFGLEDVSESSPTGLLMDTTNNLVVITNYRALAAEQSIALQLRLINPTVAGVTGSGVITTYTDSTLSLAIDQDSTNAFTTISSIDAPISYSITTQNLITNTVQTEIEFSVTPSTSYSNGVLRVKFSSDFGIGTISAGSCQIQPNGGSYTTATCTSSGNTISITGVTFTNGVSNLFKLNNLIQTPPANKTALIDITAYQTGGTIVIESWAASLTVVAPVFTSQSVSSLCVGDGKATVLTFTFVPTAAIPPAAIQTTTNDTKGVIEFEFSGTANDLGTGLTSAGPTPCLAETGLTASSGAIICTLIPGSVPVIRVSNFESITASTSIKISFPKIKNPTPVPSGNSYSVTIKTYKLVNRIRENLNQASVSVSVATSSAYTDSGDVASTTYILTNNVVSSNTDFSFTTGTAIALTGPGTFIVELPFYDIGWISTTNSITCQLAGTTTPCTSYPGADWVVITLSGSFPANSVINIRGLTVPRYSTTLSAGPLVRYISSQQELVNRLQRTAPPAATVPEFTTAEMTVSAMGDGAVDVLYSLELRSPNEIFEGCLIVINFPSDYNLLASNPPVEVSSTGLTGISTTLPLSYDFSFSQVTVSNFQKIPAGTSFRIYIDGVRNPSGSPASSGWTVQVSYISLTLSGTLVNHPNFATFTYTAASATKYLTVNSVKAFPINALELADYTISFTPVTPIPAFGEIHITFPSANYKSLPSPPLCQVSGGINTFSTCSLSGSTYIIALDTQYNAGMINVMIKDVKNPREGTTELFRVSTYYDGLVLDKTETVVTANRQITLEAQSNEIKMVKLTFDPKNEGEQAAYTFSFLPFSVLSSTMEIDIIFPSKYDEKLGNTISCHIVSGLEGNIVCVVKNRMVTLTGFIEYTSDVTNPVTIEIRGVVNPNKLTNADTGQFKVGIREQGATNYIDFNAKSGTLETVDAPGWAILWNVRPENQLARTSSDYFFNFSTFSNIPQKDLGGAVQIDLPPEFEINDSDMVCESLTASFATVLSCYIKQNSIMITGNTKEFGGNIALVVRAITNPVSAGVTSDIQIKIYDSFSSQIIERTYQNLDPFSLSYILPGPLILINNDDPIIIERGTQSQDYYITTDYPSALSLLFNPTTPGFTIIPFYISLPLGQTSASFRITVPESFSLGTYYVQWKVLNELVPAYYTPIRRTAVTIVSNRDLIVQVPDIYSIPLGGNSLPLVFKLPTGPETGLEIKVSFLTDYPGVYLSTDTITFTPGQKEGLLIVSALSNSTVTDGTLVFTLSGTNVHVYTLSATQLNFTIIAEDIIAPSIIDFSALAIDKNSAKFDIIASEICMAYYMIALAHTDTPPLGEVINKGPAKYTSTVSRYGSLLIANPGVAQEIYLENLVAETPYTIFLYLVDRGGNDVGPQILSFNTLNRYDAADFTLRFVQDGLNEAEIKVCMNTVAFLLSLDPSQVQERKYAFSRRLSDASTSHNNNLESHLKPRKLPNAGLTVVHLQIMAIPDSTLYPSPIDLALMLNDKRTQLNERLNHFDPTYITTATNFVRYVPAYSGTPTWQAVGYTWSSFTGALNNYGLIYVICMKSSDDTGMPTAYQVWRGLTNKNVETYHGRVEVSQASTQFIVNITGLDHTTEYVGYIIGGSVHPGFPDLMPDSSVVRVSFKTDTPPIVVTTVKKKSAVLVKGVSTVLIGLICLILMI